MLNKFDCRLSPAILQALLTRKGNRFAIGDARSPLRRRARNSALQPAYAEDMQQPEVLLHPLLRLLGVNTTFGIRLMKPVLDGDRRPATVDETYRRIFGPYYIGAAQVKVEEFAGPAFYTEGMDTAHALIRLNAFNCGYANLVFEVQNDGVPGWPEAVPAELVDTLYGLGHTDTICICGKEDADRFQHPRPFAVSSEVEAFLAGLLVLKHDDTRYAAANNMAPFFALENPGERTTSLAEIAAVLRTKNSKVHVDAVTQLGLDAFGNEVRQGAAVIVVPGNPVPFIFRNGVED